MGRIVAMGGGYSLPLMKYIVDMVKKPEKHFLFVGTPSGDEEDKYVYFRDLMGDLGCVTRDIQLIRKKYTEAETDEILGWADIIFVPGGDTYLMMEVWKNTGFDKKLKEVYEKDGAILCGSSAGGICWFKKGYSDCSRCRKPDHEYGWVDGLGIVDKVFSPHYHTKRKAEFDEETAESDFDGFGMEDETAYVEDNGKISFIRSEDGLSAYILRHTEKGIGKEKAAITTV